MSTDFWWLWIVLVFMLFALLIWFLGRRKEPSPPNMAHSTAQLREVGITTFAALAAAEMCRLDGIINAVNLQDLTGPYSWQQQASLAAEGRWVELKGNQAVLKGLD